MADEPLDPTELTDESESEADQPDPNTAGRTRQARDTYQTLRKAAARRKTALAASNKLAAKIATRAIPFVGWLMLGWDLLSNPLTRRIGLGLIAITLVIQLTIALMIVSLLGLIGEKFFGTGFGDPASATNADDMNAIRLVFCLDQKGPGQGPEQRLTPDCIEINRVEITKARPAITNLKQQLEQAKAGDDKDQAVTLLATMEAALANIEAANGVLPDTETHANTYNTAALTLKALWPRLNLTVDCQSNLGKTLAMTAADNSYGYVNPVAGQSKSGAYAGDDGLDLHAQRGTPVVAIADGSVRYQNNMDGSHIAERWSQPPNDLGAVGLSITDGSAIHYAHLSAIDTKLKAGDTVKQGQVIGCVGKANNVAHLHIGVYPNHNFNNPIGPFELEKLWFR